MTSYVTYTLHYTTVYCIAYKRVLGKHFSPNGFFLRYGSDISIETGQAATALVSPSYKNFSYLLLNDNMMCMHARIYNTHTHIAY